MIVVKSIDSLGKQQVKKTTGKNVQKSSQPSIKTNRVIHTTIRSSHPSKSRSELNLDSPDRSGSSVKNYIMNASTQSGSAKDDERPIQKKNNRLEDMMGPTESYHRDRKKQCKCSLRTILIVKFIVLLLLIALATTLILLLVKPKSKKSIDKTAVLRWNATGITVAGRSSIPGNSSSQLCNPWGLAMTHDYTLYIADRLNNRIQKYIRGSSVGITVAGFANGTAGSTNASLRNPSAVLVDSNENIYIADAENHRIQFWRRTASSGITIAGDGTIGTGLNQFNVPYGIAMDWSNDILYASDFFNDRVLSYNSGITMGDLVFGNNGNGNNTNQLNRPVAMYFDAPSQNILVSNRDSSTLVRWKPRETIWSLFAGSIQGISGAHGFTLDPIGNVYVADTLNHRIVFFEKDQSNGTTVAGITGSLGNSNLALYNPFAVVLDNQLNLYVADYTNHRIQKFLRY